MDHFQFQPKQKKEKKLDKIKIWILPVTSLAAIGAILAFPVVSEARIGRHRRRSIITSSSTQVSQPTNTQTQATTTTSQTTTPVASTAPATTVTSTPASSPTAPAPTTTPTQTTNTTSTTLNIPFLSNLVGYWKLNGNASSALGKDNGASFGNVTYVPGKFGQAAHFDGKSYIEIPSQSYFSPATTGEKMTFSFWFKPDTYNFPGINEGYVDFMGKTDWDSGANIEWQFRLDNETAYDGFPRPERMNFYVFNKTGGLGAGSALNNACPLNTWTHVVGEVDGTSTKLYINGKLVDQDLLSDYNINMSATTAPLRIGTSDKESFLQGSMSNVMIYNRALSDSEVQQLYQTDLSK